MYFCEISKYINLKNYKVVAHKSTSSEIGMLLKIFQQYDTKGIGHLDYDQFKAAIADPNMTETDYRRVFDAVVHIHTTNNAIIFVFGMIVHLTGFIFFELAFDNCRCSHSACGAN